MIKQALEVNPHNRCALAQLGNTYRAIGETQKSEDAHELALEEKPNISYSWLTLFDLYELALDYEDSGEIKKALKAYEIFLHIEPNNPLIWKKIAEIYSEKNKFEQSQLALRQAEEIINKEINKRLRYGYSYAIFYLDNNGYLDIFKNIKLPEINTL